MSWSPRHEIGPDCLCLAFVLIFIDFVWGIFAIVFNSDFGYNNRQISSQNSIILIGINLPIAALFILKILKNAPLDAHSLRNINVLAITGISIVMGVFFGIALWLLSILNPIQITLIVAGCIDGFFLILKIIGWIVDHRNDAQRIADLDHLTPVQ
jgi:hypothetical protein